MHNTMMNLIIPIVVILVLWSLWGVFSSRVEQADYTVVRKAHDYEIREYPAHIVAQRVRLHKRKKSLIRF